VQTVEGFGPEPGEQAQPIAMGRQVLWGGKGRPPSREVMNAAAKAARSEMMQRIRDNKDKQGQGQGRGNGGGRNGNAQKADGQSARGGNGQEARNGNGQGRRGGSRPPQPANGHGARPPQQQQARDGARRERAHDEDGEERMPRNVDPLRTNLPGRRDMTGVKRVHAGGQPDPTRTSIDSMGATGRRNNNRGGGGRGGNPARNYR
jgi:ATP-dependent RNA helicase RhlE